MILKLGKRFLCFFDMSLQKNVKSHVFLDFEKKTKKNVFSNYGARKRQPIKRGSEGGVPGQGSGGSKKAAYLNDVELLFYSKHQIFWASTR